MAAEINPVSQFPLTFSVAHAATVTRSSTNKDFTIRSLADMIAKQPPLAEEILNDLIAKHGVKQGTLEAKKLTPILYFGQYPDGARVRTKDNIEAATAIVFDFDQRAGDNVTRTDFLAACKEHNLQVLLHDSFSAGDDGKTFRAIFPCAPLATDCYQAAALGLKNLLGMGPGSILPVSQGFFYTSRPGRSPNVQALFGKPVDQVLDFAMLEAITADITPGKQAAASSKWDELDMLDHMFDDAGKALYMRCIQAINPWSEDRGHWIGVIGAGLRGWGLTPYKLGHLHELNESEKAIIERLEEWSKNERPDPGCDTKYEPGCVAKEGLRLYSGAKKTGLRAIVQKAHDASPDGIEALLEGEEELTRLALTMLGHKPQAAEKVIDLEEIAELPAARQAGEMKRQALAERQALVIHNMPAVFGRVRDWCVEFASKGLITKHADLAPDYRFPIDPITAILNVAQMLSVVIGGRVWVDQNNNTHPPTQLNLYTFVVGGSGTGKTTAMGWLRGIMGDTPFAHSMCANMSFSAGGFWPATFDHVGYNVWQFVDEGKNLIGGSDAGNLAANLDTLHKLLLTAYSDGAEGRMVSPPNYSTGGKSMAKSGNSFVPVREPNLNILAVATHEIVPRMSNAEFLQSGFSARFIVRIEPDRPDESDEQVVDRHMVSCFNRNAIVRRGDASGMLQAQRRFAAHITTLDVELSKAGRGYPMSNLVGSLMFEEGDGALVTPAIYKAASEERQKEERTNQYILKCEETGRVLAESELFFKAYVRDNELLKAVRQREAEKLTKLAAIYTLGATPDALFIEPDVARYLMEVLQMAQLDFLKLEAPIAGVPVPWVGRMKMLEREVKPGGMLFDAGPEGISGTKLGDGNSAWKALIKDANLRDEDLKGLRTQAKQVMEGLHVKAVPNKGVRGTTYILVR